MKSKSHIKRKKDSHSQKTRTKGDPVPPTVTDRSSGSSQPIVTPETKPSQKSMTDIVSDIEAQLAKDIVDLQIQHARLGLVGDFIRVFVENHDKHEGSSPSQEFQYIR